MTNPIRSAVLPAALLSVFALGSLASPARAQSTGGIEFPAASPAASVKQRIGLTDVELSYSRPSRKGRAIFGALVPFGQVWRCGANSATKLSFSTPVKFGGVDVPAGSYALFAVPDVDEWTLILNSVSEQWGSYQHDPSKDVAQVQVATTALVEPVETLEIGFSDLASGSATFYIAWEKMRVPVSFETNLVALLVPKIEAAMAGAGEKPYFQAAMFYFENGLDLKKALTWIDAGITAEPQAFYMIYRKGLIQAKMGDKAGAAASAQASLALAKNAQGAIRDEYVGLNEALLASLR